MKLTASGTIRYLGYTLRHTFDGFWSVNRGGRMIGRADTLADVDGVIETHQRRVRERLAKVEAQAAAKAEPAA